jgi:hypothetical protein
MLEKKLDNTIDKPIYYAIILTNNAKKNYTTTEKEAFML